MKRPPCVKITVSNDELVQLIMVIMLGMLGMKNDDGNNNSLNAARSLSTFLWIR